MQTLELLGVALGLGTLAGLNLYLTVFVTGLAIREGWIALYPQYEALAVLADPVILTVAGVLFALEFFADKIPWVDSLWDAVHIVIRPIGGAMLAILVLGEAHPVYDVLVGLLAGGMALTAHGAKAGTRLVANTSPEPFSNLGLSLAEDATVLAGLVLISHYPLAAFGVVILVLGVALWAIPRIWAAARASLWFLWHRCRPVRECQPSGEPMPAELEMALTREAGEDARVLAAAPCWSGGGNWVKRNRFGWMLLLERSGGLELRFARGTASRPEVFPLRPVEGFKALHRPGLLRDRVAIYQSTGSEKQIFFFDRTRRPTAELVVNRIGRASGSAAAPVG